MRKYMPGPHSRFLEDVSSIANLRSFVSSRQSEASLNNAFNGAVAMLADFRDKHIKLVTRYIIMPSRNPKKLDAAKAQKMSGMNIATASSEMSKVQALGMSQGMGLYGTGGTQLIPFLKQTRDETMNTALQGS